MNFSEIKEEDGMQKLLLSIGAVAAGLLMKEAMKSGYERLYHEKVPSETGDEKIDWPRLLLWSAASGITVSVMQVLLKRYSHIAFQKK